jgi:hypothetical protein
LEASDHHPDGLGELDRGVAKDRADVRGEGSAARKQYKGRGKKGRAWNIREACWGSSTLGNSAASRIIEGPEPRRNPARVRGC